MGFDPYERNPDTYAGNATTGVQSPPGDDDEAKPDIVVHPFLTYPGNVTCGPGPDPPSAS
ncbi:MAG: hypothetical protein ACYS19_12515 [Planctomycetota bacterium]